MADDEGVRRRDVLKGLGVTGAVAGLVAATAPPAVQEAIAQPAAPHVHAVTRDGKAADTFRFFTPLEAAVVVALVDTLIPKDDVVPAVLKSACRSSSIASFQAPMAAVRACILRVRSAKARRSKATSYRWRLPISTALALPTSTLGA